MNTPITSEIVVAYSLCPRKAFLLLSVDQAQPPLPKDFPEDNQSIAFYSFSEYGRWAFYASFDDTTKVRVGQGQDK